jgi:DNA (cytosine-5)-methyltransferase 1
MNCEKPVVGWTFCSGIGAPEVAAPWVDWQLASEIEPFPRAVLAERFGYQDARHATAGPRTWGDFTAFRVRHARRLSIPLPDLIVAGTPCQAFSVAGMRGGLNDDRGNLTLEFVRTVHAIQSARPDGKLTVLWENVPGVLSDKSNAFGCFLGAIVGDEQPLVHSTSWPGAGMVSGPRARAAWIVRDAQYFGVAQRRRRVFVVVDFGNRVDPAKVLFERQGLHGNPQPCRKAGQDVAGALDASTGGASGKDWQSAKLAVQGHHGDIAGTVSSKWSKGSGGPAGDETQNMVAFDCKGAEVQHDRIAPPLRSMGHSTSHQNAGGHAAVAFDLRGRQGGAQLEGPHETANLRAASGGSSRSYLAKGPIVRRLTPRECARLQGFPDTHCEIAYGGKPAADGPQYKAYGNSMAVPVVAWIFDRIKLSGEGKL